MEKSQALVDNPHTLVAEQESSEDFPQILQKYKSIQETKFYKQKQPMQT